ncbi:hypothetical protein [Pseudomonas sp. G(2018)]|nr:hypothetical protein [Pseudomonas sp. G(2018)]
MAVYRSSDGANTASCAVFQANTQDAVVETEVVKRLAAILKAHH